MLVPTNPFSATPTTVTGRPLSVIVEPATSGDAPKSRRHMS